MLSLNTWVQSAPRLRLSGAFPRSAIIARDKLYIQTKATLNYLALLQGRDRLQGCLCRVPVGVISTQEKVHQKGRNAVSGHGG